MEGPVREARWLGDGMLAVSGTDYSVEAGTSGAERFLQALAGVRLIDTRSWTSRLLGPRWLSGRGGARRGAGRTLGLRGGGGYGPGLRAFGLDGKEHWRLHAGEYRWMDAAGSVGYVHIGGDMADVVDLAAGAVVSRVAHPFPASRGPVVELVGARGMADAPAVVSTLQAWSASLRLFSSSTSSTRCLVTHRPRGRPPPREPVLRDRLPVRVTARRDRGEVRRRRVCAAAATQATRTTPCGRLARRLPCAKRSSTWGFRRIGIEAVSSSSRTPSRRSRRARP